MKSETLKGYLILFLAMFIFTMWGVNLFSLSEIDEDKPDPKGPNEKPAVTGTVSTIRRIPRPFLYFYFQEIGYKVDCSFYPPPADGRLMFVINPPPDLHPNFVKDLIAWVEGGGNVILFQPAKNPLGTHLGAEFGTGAGPATETRLTELHYVREVQSISGSVKFGNPRGGMSFYSIFSDESKRPTVLTTFRGKGQILVFYNIDFFTPDGLEKADNLVYLTRAAERLAPDKRIWFHDPNPGMSVLARVRSGGGEPATIKTSKVKTPYLSLWSLVKANPISWVLAQLILALTIYFFSSGRRFGRVVPLPPDPAAVGTFIGSMGRLLHEQGNLKFAAERVLRSFIPSANRRFALPAGASSAALIDAVAAADPAESRKLRSAIDGLEAVSSGRDEDPANLLRHVQTLERFRKEHKVNA